MANTAGKAGTVRQITAADAEQRWPGALGAWRGDPPAALHTDGDSLLADSADGWPHVWCPEQGEWDAL